LEPEQIIPTKKEPEPMKTLEIIDQLLKGNHLEPKELRRAWLIVEDLKEILEYRTAGESK
jgi:hypothetical protein